MGRSSKVQRAFSKAREAEAKRQNEIKIAESEVSKISQARSTLSLLNNRMISKRGQTYIKLFIESFAY